MLADGVEAGRSGEKSVRTCYSVWMKNPEGIMNKNVTVLFKIVVTSTSQAKETEVMSEKR